MAAFDIESTWLALWQWLTHNGAVTPDGTDPSAYENQSRHSTFTITPVISTSPAYTAGDELGGLNTVASAARVTGKGGVIRSVTVIDKTQAQRAAFDILLFNATVTTAGDNAAFAVSDADMLKCVGVINVVAGDYNTAFAGTPLNSVAYKPSTSAITQPPLMAIPYTCAATSLFVQCITRGTPTYTTTSDLQIILDVVLD